MTETDAVQRLGLAQVVPLSRMLLLMYIDYITTFCPRYSTPTVLLELVGKAEITLIADEVVLHIRDWTSRLTTKMVGCDVGCVWEVGPQEDDEMRE